MLIPPAAVFQPDLLRAVNLRFLLRCVQCVFLQNFAKRRNRWQIYHRGSVIGVILCYRPCSSYKIYCHQPCQVTDMLCAAVDQI